MLFSTKGRYALRVMIDLAEHNNGGLVPLQEISLRQNISKKYLESIVVILSKAGLVISQQGKNGGYRLARLPAEYTVAEILELTDGSLAPVECVSKTSIDCPNSETCKTFPLWSELNELIHNFLNGKTLADLLPQKSNIKAVCISEKKGEQKRPVDSIELIANHGIDGDAHAGDWHRQVSLLASESVAQLQPRVSFELLPGAFAENILTEGIKLKELSIGTKLKIGTALCEVTQIGKECHADCTIRRAAGDCVMPREGIFVKVLESGTARAGDEIIVQI